MNSKEELKAVKQELIEKEALLHTMINNIPFAFWARDIDGVCFMQNEAAKKIYGNLIGTTIDNIGINEKEKKYWKDNFANALKGEITSVESKEIIDGKETYIHRITAPIKDENNIYGVLSIGIDITDQIKLEQIKQQSFQNQQLLTDISHRLIHSKDFDKTMNFLIEKIGSYLNADRVLIVEGLEDEPLHSVFEWTADETAQKITDKIFGLKNKSEYNYLGDELEKSGYYIIQKGKNEKEDRLIKQIDDFGSIIILPIYLHEKLHAILSINRLDDKKWKKYEINLLKTAINLISSAYERKNFIDRLNETFTKFKTLFDKSADPIFITDMQGNIRDFNEKAIDLIQYKKNDIYESNITDFIFHRQKERFSELIRNITGVKETIFEGELISSNGRKIPVEATISVIRLIEDTVLLMIFRDITLRKNFEKQIFSTIIQTEEKERSKFAMELHDGLGAILSSINIYINMLQQPDLKREEREHLLLYVKNLVGQAITTAKEIANDLKPTILSRFGLIDSLQSFIEGIRKTGIVEVEFKYDKFNRKIDKDLEIILFRIANELINNTLKHAQAKKITLELLTEANNIEMYYTDDGVGFDIDEVKEKKSGMGLNNIVSRIASINGECKIKSKPGKGMLVAISIPEV